MNWVQVIFSSPMSLEWFLVLVCTGSYLKVLSGELSFPDGWNLFLIPTMIEANHWVQMHLLVAKAPVPKESAQVFSRVWTTPTFYRTGSRWSAGTGYDTINCPVIRHGKGQQRTNPFFSTVDKPILRNNEPLCTWWMYVDVYVLVPLPDLITQWLFFSPRKVFGEALGA